MTSISMHFSRVLLIVLLLPLALAACGKTASPAAVAPQAPPPAVAPETAVPAVPAEPASAAAGTAPAAPSQAGPVATGNAPRPASNAPAEVVFASGEVQGQRQGAWSDLEIGAKLEKDDAIRVGAASECQLRFADMAVVSIRENTQVSLDSLSLSRGNSQVRLGLKSGTVLSKVKKLAGKDSFTVRTDTAVGGVRGTEFGVTVTPQGGTLVTVKEGTVAVLPAAYDPDAVRALSSDKEPGLEQIAKDIETSAPAVHAGQEITVSPEQAAKAETAFQVVQAAAVQIVEEQHSAADKQSADGTKSFSAAAAAPPSVAITERLKSIQSATAAVTAMVGAPQPLTPVHVNFLKQIDALPALSLPPSRGSSAAPTPASVPAAAPTRISVSAVPADSAFEVNGKPAGTGSYEAVLKPGAALTLVIRHEGYAAKTLVLSSDSPAANPVRLEPAPLESRFVPASAPLVGVVQVAGDLLVGADRQGQLFAVDRQGRMLWKTPTKNTPNENASPVLGAGKLYFSGQNEFLVLSLGTGTVISRAARDSATTHLFGQRVAVSSSLGVYPTATSLALFDPATGATTRQIPLPGGTLMSPVIAEGRLLIVSQTGDFYAIDPQSGQVLFQVPTGARQPVAGSVHVAGSRAFFTNRKGILVCVDMDARAVVWKTPLNATGAAGIFQDLEISPEGIFAFAGDTIYAVSAADGSPLFPPISGASTPPLCRAGRLYFGTEQGTLASVDAGTGKRESTLDLKDVASTRPQADGPRILIGSSTGQVFVIYPDAMQ